MISNRLGQPGWGQLFRERAGPGISLQWQIREMFASAILDGRIPKGAPLPSCRELARDLGVARYTVVLAYEQLADEGFLFARERSGYFVRDEILSGRVPCAAPQTKSGAGPDWDRRCKFKPSTQRNITKAEDWQRYDYPFLYGQLDPTLFPIADWRECCRQALSVLEIRGWASDKIDGDDPVLIEQIQTRLLSRRGILVPPEQILATVGAQHALYLLAALLMRAEDTVGIEDPGYPDARNIFSLQSPRLAGLSVDRGGLIVDSRLDECDYVYVTPSHQSPTTVTMPLERRHALLSHATEADFVIVEDDYECELNYLGTPSPALKSLDHNDRVIYVGSLSKTLAPGLRFGYLVAPPELICEARSLRRLMIRHPATNNQRAIALFLKLGHHDSLVQRLSHAYRQRWQVMGEALDRYLPEAAHIPTFGGTSFWVGGPEGLDSRELARQAKERGILIEPGDVHFMSPQAPRNYFRLRFSSIHVERIEPGIRKLAELIEQLV